MRILLLSAYDAKSHRYWREGLVAAFPEYEWTVLTLPPRHFNWRIRGNSLSWAFEERDVLERGYDLLIATSMTDISALKGFIPKLALTPTIVYFHENQFAYPSSDQQFNSIEPQVLNLYSALAANYICFNSDFNRQSFMAEAQLLLSKMPDHVPTGLVDHLMTKSEVLHVPLADTLFNDLPNQKDQAEKHVLWNHRWEYDKGPDRLYAGIKKLAELRDDFKLHVVGERFRQSPAVFNQMKLELDHAYPNIIQSWGYIESKSEYLSLVERCDIVLSTAIHDFQGLSILEAVAKGCVPLVPRRLAYTELFADSYYYDEYLEDPEAEAGALARSLSDYLDNLPQVPDVSRLSWSSLRPAYEDLLRSIANK